MARSRTTTFVLMLLVAPLVALVAACGGGGGDGGGELPLIRAYFRASNVGDRGSLANIAMYAWNARERGAVSSPSIDSVSEVRSRPLRVKELSEALAAAQAEEESFTEEKIAYQDENFDAINRVLEAERDDEDVASRDSDVQEAWTDWRNRTMEHSKMVSDASQQLRAEQDTASLSVFDPNNAIDLTEFDGEIRTKDVQITANVELDGSESEQSMTITLQRTVLTGAGEDGADLLGRWVVANIS